MRIRFCMKIIFFLWIVLAGVQPLLASAMTPPVQEDLRSRNYRLNTLFKLSKMGDVLGNIEYILQKSGNINEDALAPGQGEFAQGIMPQAYSSGKFYRALRRPFNEDYKPQYVRSVVQWYRSALGKRILKLEREANEPTNRLAMGLFVKKLLNSPPDEKRTRLVERIERSSHLTEAGKNLFLGYVKLMQPFNRYFEGKTLSRELRKLEKSITEPMREVVLHSLLFSYRNLKDKEIEEYARFLNSQSGQWFSQTLLKGFKKGV